MFLCEGPGFIGAHCIYRNEKLPPFQLLCHRLLSGFFAYRRKTFRCCFSDSLRSIMAGILATNRFSFAFPCLWYEYAISKITEVDRVQADADYEAHVSLIGFYQKMKPKVVFLPKTIFCLNGMSAQTGVCVNNANLKNILC